jgi:hypothetical protein
MRWMQGATAQEEEEKGTKKGLNVDLFSETGCRLEEAAVAKERER